MLSSCNLAAASGHCRASALTTHPCVLRSCRALHPQRTSLTPARLARYASPVRPGSGALAARATSARPALLGPPARPAPARLMVAIAYRAAVRAAVAAGRGLDLGMRALPSLAISLWTPSAFYLAADGCHVLGFATAAGGNDCAQCPVGSYGLGGSTSSNGTTKGSCTQCPAGSTTLTSGNKDVSDCVCLPG